MLGSMLTSNDAINTFAALANGSVRFYDANSLTISQIADDVDNELLDDGEAGISGVSAGGVDPMNNLAIDLLAAGANTFININAGANVTSLAGSHRYTADNMDIQGTITALATDFSVNLRNANANVAIDLGADLDANADTLELSEDELNNITTNLLAIGRNTGNVSVNITITDAISPAGTDTLHLITGGTGTVTDAANGAIIETNLLIEAAGGATLDNIASHDVDVLAAIVTNPGASFTFRDLDDLTIGTVARLTLDPPNNDDGLVGVGAVIGIDTNGGNVLLISEDSDPAILTGPLAGVGVLVANEIETTADAGGLNSGSIMIQAQGEGSIVLNAALITTGTTAGGNGEGGDITLTTDNADITLNATGLLNALGGGGTPMVDGGNITIDAGRDLNGALPDVTDSDVIILGDIQTNDIVGGTNRGNISITADDAVTIGPPIDPLIPTTIQTTGRGTVSIIANDANTDGDGDGRITMNPNTQIITELGNVTLRTRDHAVTMPPLDDASIIVERINTTVGNIIIDANGQNADVFLRGTIMTGGAGAVTVTADDSITFEAAGMILVSGTGNVLVQANENVSDGDSNDQILMADGSLISTNTGTITLRTDGANGGNITLGRLVTQNITNAAVTINAQLAVVDGDPINADGVDIEAIADAASRVNIIATAGIGAGNAIETTARRFDVQNIGAADVNIANTTANLNVVIEKLTTLGGNIVFTNQSGTTSLLTLGDQLIPGTRVSSGDAGTNVDGGDITINTSGDLRVIAPISSRDGRGGMFTLTGGAVFDAGSSIQLGAGDITITTGSLDILFNSPLMIDNGPAQFLAPRDIIVNVALTSRVDDGAGNFVDATTQPVLNTSPIDSNITLRADNNSDESGGVLVRGIGSVVASGSLTLEGSDLFADGLLVGGIQNGVHIERDPGNGNRLLSAGDLTLQNRPGITGADIVISGKLGTQTATVGPSLNVAIIANDNIYLADNTTVFSPANVSFGDVTNRSSVIDDGDGLTDSNLVVNANGITTFFGPVGDDPDVPNVDDRIDSLTTNVGGQTHIRGGIVNTVGFQDFRDDVLVNADTNLFDTTTFTAGGNANFLGNVQGLNLGGAIEDDLVLNVAGTTTFVGLVGVDSTTDPQRIGDGMGRAITVNSTGDTFFNNRVFTQSGILQIEEPAFPAPRPRITFREDVKIDAGDIGSDFLSDVTFDSLTFFSNGNVTFGTTGLPNVDELFILVGSRIDTSAQSRSVTINSRVTDPVENNVTLSEDLFLKLNQGDLFINGSVGIGNANRFGDLVIDSANDFFFSRNDGVQSIFSESLTQLDGIDNGLDLADTELRGTINTTLISGVTLATTNVMYDADIFTNGGFVRTQTRNNISHTTGSSITTLGGMVVSDASGHIIMQEGAQAATINTDNNMGVGGLVVMRAMFDISVSQIQSSNSFVSLTATNGAVIDSADLGNVNDIQTGQLRLFAATGIGFTGNSVLETQVSNLEAHNMVSGRILVSNTGELSIGGVGTPMVATMRNNGPTIIMLPSLGGIQNLNGDIGMTNVGNLTALANTLVQSTNGTVGLFVEGNALFLGEVRAVNNGHIFVDASGNFTLMNDADPNSPDFQTDGTGKIVVTSDQTVNFDPSRDCPKRDWGSPRSNAHRSDNFHHRAPSHDRRRCDFVLQRGRAWRAELSGARGLGRWIGRCGHCGQCGSGDDPARLRWSARSRESRCADSDLPGGGDRSEHSLFREQFFVDR